MVQCYGRPWKCLNSSLFGLLKSLKSVFDFGKKYLHFCKLTHSLLNPPFYLFSETFLCVCCTFPWNRCISHHLLQHPVSSLPSWGIQLRHVSLSWHSPTGVCIEHCITLKLFTVIHLTLLCQDVPAVRPCS